MWALHTPEEQASIERTRARMRQEWKREEAAAQRKEAIEKDEKKVRDDILERRG